MRADDSSAVDLALGCVGCVITAFAFGFGVIIVGCLFGIGLRLSGI